MVRQSPEHKRSKRNHTPNHTPNGEVPVELSLANEAQFLLLTLSSLEQLIGEIRERDPTARAALDISNLASRFRANLIVETRQDEAYVEEGWRDVRIGGHLFQVCCAVMYCTALCCAALCYAVLYFSTVHCTMLHCTVLQYSALCCTALCCSATLHCTVVYICRWWGSV